MNGLTINHYLILSAMLFATGVLAVTLRRNAIGLLIGIELMLNAAALQFAAHGRFSANAADPQGQTAAVFVIVVAAAEAAVALSIVLTPSSPCSRPR